MKRIKVPQLLQDINSLDCGPICVQMILGYFGIEKDLKTLIGQIKSYKEGASAYDMGSLLLGAGLKVTAITAQPFLFSPDTAPGLKPKEELIKLIDQRSEGWKSFKPVLKTFKKFLNDGGNVKIEIPLFTHIKKAIDKGSPMIALIAGTALGSKEGGFHFVVVSGYSGNKVFINNTLPDSKQKAWFPIERFLYALHASTMYEVDNGTLLVVSK